jgi:hypothetical protein
MVHELQQLIPVVNSNIYCLRGGGKTAQTSNSSSILSYPNSATMHQSRHRTRTSLSKNDRQQPHKKLTSNDLSSTDNSLGEVGQPYVHSIDEDDNSSEVIICLLPEYQKWEPPISLPIETQLNHPMLSLISFFALRGTSRRHLLCKSCM